MKKPRYILSIDQGTSATKAVLFNDAGQLIGRVDAIHHEYYPQPGWVEHDAKEIYFNVCKAVGDLLELTGVSAEGIVAAGISNQRETVVVWDKITGEPVYNAIVWQCARAQQICADLKADGDKVRAYSGLMLSPYFSAAKIKWILDNVLGAREKAEQGRLLLGTMDCWLLWNLTERTVHATEYSNASRTQLMNLHTLRWDEELCELFNVPLSMLPEIRFSDASFGTTDFGGILPTKIRIAGMLGDSHAALFGQTCFSPGDVKATYGTGSSMMMNVARNHVVPDNGLTASVGWGAGEEIIYALEGNINCTGATIRWLVEDAGLLNASCDAGKIAAELPDNGGVYFVPAFVGLGAPYWDSGARAAILGMSRSSKAAHIIRAAEEAIAYQVKDIHDLMASQIKLNSDHPVIRVDGGATRDEFLMQFQADMLGIPIAACPIEEISALGAAYMAGCSVGVWKQGELAALNPTSKLYTPHMDADKRHELYAGWKDAVRRVLLV